ncbi:FGGY-family carbohydrate kinase [Commensalibacter oyaizuii]|uniref:FGGY family carbohydrate kinase n=1 Tax=Commensalibacter oyaizuii TaxID=3043873 RepID=A0ABT6Q154_9PROT|nr:FGGY family carbohydrate kinase [Commensalibacter sp. TBRC 16381]MDI2090842.1 FGGY family carbohydrate kinase [Commensalibacter sp. TBRC 16381]
MGDPLVLAIDQGSSSTKCVIVDYKGKIIACAKVEISETHPYAGHVEQDANEIWESVGKAVTKTLAKLFDSYLATDIIVAGLSTQRESLLLWDRQTGKPLHPLISWQDQRQIDLPSECDDEAVKQQVKQLTGLPLDPMFSASKAKWLLDHYDKDRKRTLNGELCLGTIDSWLLFQIYGEHLIEAGNASRTQMMNVHHCDWDSDLLALFNVPKLCLPKIIASNGPFPKEIKQSLGPLRIPVGAVMGDSHSALFGHQAFNIGQVKATYGTGSSIMGLIRKDDELHSGLCLTIGWKTGDNIAYAAEGNIRSLGATLRWMAGILDISVTDLVELGMAGQSDDVALIPGFGGLGAPWWDEKAVGLITNLTLGTSRQTLARATIESVVYQVADVVNAIRRNVGDIHQLFVDGGPTSHDGLMQLQAQILGCSVFRAERPELSALGVAYMAGLTKEVWTQAGLDKLNRAYDLFEPKPGQDKQNINMGKWHKAVNQSRCLYSA